MLLRPKDQINRLASDLPLDRSDIKSGNNLNGNLSTVTMAIVEPVLINYSGQNQDSEVKSHNLVFDDWPKEATWITNRLTDGEEYKIIEKEKIRDAVQEATVEAYDEISDAAPPVIEEIVGLTTRAN